MCGVESDEYLFFWQVQWAMPNAIWTDLLTTTQTIIRGLGLTYAGGTPLPSGQVYARRVLTDRRTVLPFVMVTLGAESEAVESLTTATRRITYPVLVVHAFASNQDHTLIDDPLAWRQAITDALFRQRRPEISLARVFDCFMDMDPVIDLSLFRGNLDVGGMMLLYEAARGT
jgi:hypothetical protein